MNKLIEKIKKARFIWVCGNGGSAATADHLVTDLVKKGYRAVSLSANSSLLTMLANDYGFEYVFSRQLAIFGSQKDLLITFSCSGTSRNIQHAVESALIHRMKIHQFETFKKERDYGLLEDKHLVFVHKLINKL